MYKLHFDGANSALRSRRHWLTRLHLCEFDRLLGIEHNLYGRLVYLAEATSEPDLADGEHRLLNLCILAFRPDFRTQADRHAADLLTAGLVDWPADLLAAIDITGACHWRSVSRALLRREDLPDSLRWRLLDRWPDAVPPDDDPAPPPFRWTGAQPGEIPVRVRFERPDWTALLPEIRDSLADPDRQEDLLWLVLGALAAGHSADARGLLGDWLAACPHSTEALCAATVSGDAQFNDVLRHGVLDDRIPPFWLAVHGQADHLRFCVELFHSPAHSKTTESAWYGLTGQRISRVPYSELGLPGKPAKGQERLADFRAASSWLERHPPKGRLFLGKNHTEQPFRPRLGLFFGEWAWPATLSLWVDSGGRILTRPEECHWRRAQLLAGEAA